MCILFFYNNPAPSFQHYRLILASNRDEFYNRKTQPADYWNEDSSIIAGRDLESESKGTWLAMSTKGKIGILLNIPGPKIVNSKSRGVLPAQFVKSKYSGKEFIDNIGGDGSVYDGYHLLLFDILYGEIIVNYHTNDGTCTNVAEELPKGFHGFSNNHVNVPLQKVTRGVERFTNVITEFGSIDNKEKLVAGLIDLLKWNKRHFPDEELIKSRGSCDELLLSKYSSVFVEIPELNYGTRTHSIILIDFNGVTNFFEWTLDQPVPHTVNSKWIFNHYTMVLNLSSN